MCGIAGIWDQHRSESADHLRSSSMRMADALRHRGPDDDGCWADPAGGVALSFRRLSIVDLSPHGHQPMESRSGRYVVVFNGEIYNFRALRRELEGRGPAVSAATPTRRSYSARSRSGGSSRRSNGSSACSHLRSGTGRSVLSIWFVTVLARSLSITGVLETRSCSGPS